jgi:uncharacterized protein
VRKLLMFTLVGLVAQLIDGALGMAYGVTASSLLLANGTSAAAASASVHLAEVGTSLVSGVSHWRFGNVQAHAFRWLAAPGAVGAFAGAHLLSSVDGEAVSPYVAVLLGLLGLSILVRFAFGAVRRPVAEHRMRRRYLMPLGGVAGFVDAVGGGGWGPITTPTLMTAGRLQPHTAVGSASASEFCVSLAASIGFLTGLGRSAVDMRIVAGLLAGGVIVAPFAAWLVRRLDAAVLGSAVGGLLVLLNGRTLLRDAGVSFQTRLIVLSAVGAAALALGVRSMRRATGLRADAEAVAA